MSEMMTTLKRVMVVIAVFGGGLVLLVGSGKLWWYIGSTPMQFPDYSLDLSLGFPPADSSGDAFPDVVFEAGAAKSVVTPVVPDGWDDVDGDGRWNVLHDRWRDGNRNHGFDAVWLAGGGRSRPAAGVADDLWVRAVVFGYEGCRVALCTVDFYGLMYHDVIDIRNRVRNMSGDSLAAVDHVIVIATGNLTAPDFIGLWGPSETDTGVYRSYLDHVKQVAAETVVRAAGDMAPADVVIPQCGAEQNIATARFIDRGMRRTIAAVVNGRIPSAEGDSLSFLVSAGPSRVVKDAVEQETGGVCLWFGPGVDTTGRSTEPHTAEDFAREAVACLDGAGERLSRPGLAVRTKTVQIPANDNELRAYMKTGVVERGFSEGMLRSEVDVLRLGPSIWAFVPVDGTHFEPSGGVIFHAVYANDRPGRVAVQEDIVHLEPVGLREFSGVLREECGGI